MKVEDVMTRDVQSCTQETDLAAAAMLIQDHSVIAVTVTHG